MIIAAINDPVAERRAEAERDISQASAINPYRLVTTQVTGFRGSGFREFEEESGQEKGY
jgi:hypothetical protein